MEQALEDTAYFTQSIKRDLGLDGKLILIGASYTGDMAAWARASHPHLYHAAYASGAPVFAVVDIPGKSKIICCQTDFYHKICFEIPGSN